MLFSSHIEPFIYQGLVLNRWRKAAYFFMQPIPLTKTKDSEDESKNSCFVSSISFKPSVPSGLSIFRSELCLDPGYMVRSLAGKDILGVCLTQNFV